MKAYKHHEFEKWAKKHKISDRLLVRSLDEMKYGLIDADLGSGLYKKRIAVSNRGKSDGVRVVLAYKVENKAFFIYGFAKNQRDNITILELKQMKMYAKLLLSFDDEQLKKLLQCSEFIEVNDA